MFLFALTQRTTLAKVLIASVLGTLFYFCLLSELHAASSENFILDSAVIGQAGTIQASSTNFRTDNNARPTFYQGETIETSGGEDENGESTGSRVRITPRDIDFHVYATTDPLLLKDFQSGTLVVEHQNLNEFVTLYISPYATVRPNTKPESATVYHNTLVLPGFADLPNGITVADSIGGHLYEVTAERDGETFTTLRKFLTLIIQNPELVDTTPGAYSVYYLHPVYKVWVKMPHPAFIPGAVIFQTPYATRYFVVKNSVPKEESAPEIIRTSATPIDISNEIIRDDIRTTESQTTQNEMDESDGAYASGIQEEIPLTGTQSFMHFLREKYSQYFLPVIVGFMVFLGLILFISRRITRR